MNNKLEYLGYSVRGIANWILDYSDNEGFPQTNMSINKLVFFAYEALLLTRGRVITKAKIEAWDHGPVFRELYQDFKGYGDRAIAGRAAFFSTLTGKLEKATVQFDPEDEAAIAEVLTPLVSLSASRLRELSHIEGGAWDRVWRYKGYANPGMEITPEIILETAGSWRKR